MACVVPELTHWTPDIAVKLSPTSERFEIQINTCMPE